jgi:hypothetical protein
MATKGIVVFGVVAGFIFLIIFIVLLATSAGSQSKSGGSPTGAQTTLGPPGSAGNWTATQVAEQAGLFGALATMGQLKAAGFDATFIERVSMCAMEGASKVYSYEYMNKCNTTSANCAATTEDLRIISACVGGEKGKWTDALKNLVIDGADATMDRNFLAVYPCFVGWLASQYNFFDALAAMSTIKGANPTGPVAVRVMAALVDCMNKQGAPGG